MFVVIFEVQPKRQRWNDYLTLAGSLRPELEKIDGFISNERFASQRNHGRVLSLSTWRDEKAIVRWRTLALHHSAQQKGRSDIFEDYHLRVGEVVADAHLPKGHSPPQQRFDETETGAAKLVTISELTDRESAAGDLATRLRLPKAGTDGLLEEEPFTGINDPEKLLLLASWTGAITATAWQPAKDFAGLRHRAVRIIRDYGMRDRREAPQYHPPVAFEAECS
jgi:heme-degrading monooxygenase HmoA